MQRLLTELIPGKVKKDLTALQAKGILASVRPRDLAGRTRRQLAAWQLAELVAVEKKISALTAELKQRVKSSGSKLMDLPGVGPIVAARTLADVGDVARLTDRNRFSSWTSTAPLDASSGQQIRHRLPGSGNRRVNHMIHIAAATRSATTPLPVMDLARQLVRPGVEFDRRRLCGACCWDLAGRRAVLSGPP